MARLDTLAGRWTVQVKVEGVGPAWAEFAWQDGGQFLRQVSDVDSMPPGTPQQWRENAPFPITMVIGLDDTADDFTALYADARGVHRVYRMTFDGEVWTMSREASGFNQRFTATVRGDTIEGQWEMSEDGVNWTVDFELVYTRQSPR
jgi:hypothetical protein